MIHELRFYAYEFCRLMNVLPAVTLMAMLTPHAIPIFFERSLRFLQIPNLLEQYDKFISIFWHCRASAFLCAHYGFLFLLRIL